MFFDNLCEIYGKHKIRHAATPIRGAGSHLMHWKAKGNCSIYDIDQASYPVTMVLFQATQSSVKTV